MNRRTLVLGFVGAVATVASARLWADALPCQYEISANTVLDKKTGLTWQRVAPAQTYTFTTAPDYCAGLDLDGTGWRLPTPMELRTLVDTRLQNPAMDPVAFPNEPAEKFWTVLASQGDFISCQGKAWIVDFFAGDSDCRAKTEALRVRCVRP